MYQPRRAGLQSGPPGDESPGYVSTEKPGEPGSLVGKSDPGAGFSRLFGCIVARALMPGREREPTMGPCYTALPMTNWSPVDLLPALWVGVVGASLAGALRRWYDAVPLRVLAVFALAIVILFGTVLGLGGFLLLWLGWRGAASGAVLPGVLCGLGRGEYAGGRRDALLLALGTLALLLGGRRETILYALALAFAFLAGRIFQRPQGLRWALARRAGLTMLVAGMMAAPVLLPVAEYLPKTMRAARMGQPSPHRQVRSGVLTQTYLPLVAPNSYGDSRFVEYWGLTNTNEDASGFVGTATLLAALLAMRARRRFPQERVALGVSAVCLPLMFLASQRLLLPLSLLLAYLVACTLERFCLGEVRRSSLLIAAVALGLVIAWGYLAHPDPLDPGRLAVFRLGWLRWQLRFLGIAALLLVGTASWRRPGRSLAVTGVAVAILAELLLLHGPANPPMPPRRLALPVNGPLLFLQEKLGGGAERGPGFRMSAFGQDLPPNLASLYGLTDARIYNPMAPQAYVERLAPVVFGCGGRSPCSPRPATPSTAGWACATS